MALNDIMARLAADMERAKAKAEAPKAEAPAPVQLSEVSPERMQVYRQIWTLTKTLKCSRCAEALEGRCHRSPQRKQARQEGLPCFCPNATMLQTTTQIVDAVIKANRLCAPLD